MSASTRHVAWTGWDDDPDRLEAATVTVRDDRLAAIGTSRATSYATAWALRTGPGWVTEHLDVSVRGLGWSRHLDLVRTPDGAWRADVRESGTPPSGLAAPGIADPASLDGALDCDVALCPVTNTMPILRLGLLGDRPPADETRLVMAWVDLPSLAVLRSDQVYAAREPLAPTTGQGVVTYTSATRDFTADLTVDPDGLVVDYPHLARRL
ncbi:putative glycolipid-binding domain-containing protein [Cellulosimicrobium cellulans]|uniref:putative glycolipid-binding domain-containing protein n=1 Tax=Cellulosimicrobium cellulans TaxID=1710 RepID=UPI001EDA228A|nr:putative glycolipid-binding domain-containing protein [Cellulosimicrobium cellulans]UKJ63127.1 putative glycolipid-binding domain-containing protein [Cellulosimicrobium cellulans]